MFHRAWYISCGFFCPPRARLTFWRRESAYVHDRLYSIRKMLNNEFHAVQKHAYSACRAHIRWDSSEVSRSRSRDHAD
jgi:hypothetical protein